MGHAQGSSTGSVSGGRRTRGLGWLWALLGLLVLVAAIVAVFLVVRNAGDDDPEGIGVSGQECPEYAGNEGRDETVEVAAEPPPFFGCQVTVLATVSEVVADGVVVLEGGETGGEPIVVVRSDGADAFDGAEAGVLVRVDGEIEEELDVAEVVERLDGVDEADLEPFAGQPYLDTDNLRPQAEAETETEPEE